MRKILFILLIHPVLLGILGAVLKRLTGMNDASIIGILLGLFVVGIAGIFYGDVLRGDNGRDSQSILQGDR